jgi:hypothetical protein
LPVAAEGVDAVRHDVEDEIRTSGLTKTGLRAELVATV